MISVASLEVVVGLGEAAHQAALCGAPVVTAERLAGVYLGWLGAERIRWEVAPGFGASGESVPEACEDEVEATLRLGRHHGRGRLRRGAGDAMPLWDERVRVALGRAFAAAAVGDIRYVGFKLLLRALLAECDSPGEWMEFVRRFHLRPDEEFLGDGRPDAAVCVTALRTIGLVTGPDPALLSIRGNLAARAATWVSRRRGWGPLGFPLRMEATRQAVRAGDAQAGQAHLLMATSALEAALERTGSRFTEAAAPFNAGGRALAELGGGYAVLKDYAERGPLEPAERGEEQQREDPPYGADLHRAFADAARLAADLGHPEAGTSHLVYVIAADGEGPGARALRSLGADPAAIAVWLGRDLAP